jgi:hypothetical protein
MCGKFQLICCSAEMAWQLLSAKGKFNSLQMWKEKSINVHALLVLLNCCTNGYSLLIQIYAKRIFYKALYVETV